MNQNTPALKKMQKRAIKLTTKKIVHEDDSEFTNLIITALNELSHKTQDFLTSYFMLHE